MSDVPGPLELGLELLKLSMQIEFPTSEKPSGGEHNSSLAQHFDSGSVPEEGKLPATRYTLDDLHQLAPNSNILAKQSGSELAGAIFDIFPCSRCDIEATKHQIINGYPANFWLSCLFLVDPESKKMVGIETDKLTVLSACFQAYNQQPDMKTCLDIQTHKFFQLCPAMLTRIKHDSLQHLKKGRVSGGLLLR